MAGRHTPVMQQFHAAKKAYPDCILFFRLGDFYEMFEEDAVVCARALDLTLTSRNKGKPDEVPMAGVPHHAAHSYVARLLALGHKVAVCEQMADPAKTRGIVPREVVRVITPGTITDEDQLEATENNWLAAAHVTEGEVGFALLDLSTGELSAASLPDVAATLGALARTAPKEVILSGTDDPAVEASAREAVAAAIRPPVPPTAFPEAIASEAEKLAPTVRAAVEQVTSYAASCTPGNDLPVRRIGSWDAGSSLGIDPVAQRHLELVQSMSGDRATTLLGVIDTTKTPMGARLLRRRLLSPLVSMERIRRRLDRVELFVMNPRVREELRNALAGVRDLERLGTRAQTGDANPRDLGALRDGLQAADAALGILEAVSDPAWRETLGLDPPVDRVSDLAEALDRALVERPPALPKDGAVFRDEFDSALAELAELKRSGSNEIVELESRLREQTGIAKLRIKYTKVFGWYVEVGRSQAAKAPEEWRRKQTVASGERYTLDELDELADAITHAEQRHRDRELELLSELRDRAAACGDRIATVASHVARWDVAAALADVAHRYDYCRPDVDEGDEIVIKEGRHPVVERLAAAGRFVPNDTRLAIGAERLWLVTGPNMAGKSTLLRQVALIVILAQMGSYVPAAGARVGLVDRVLSRVGASDNLARGESTFMVEMRETATILRDATRRSLVILDEIGRGTSTFDGLAIAWAVAEHLDDAVGCRALFATHYHELTSLADESKHVANYSVSARELDEDVVFLHRVVPGAASRSYGVAVAKLAGLPESVLARARAVLRSLEEESPRRAASPTEAPDQLGLFGEASPARKEETEVVETLRAADLDRMTPLDALTLLARLKKRL